MEKNGIKYGMIGNKVAVNVTGHNLTFWDNVNDPVTIPPSGMVLNAEMSEISRRKVGDLQFVRQIAASTREGDAVLNRITSTFGTNVLVIGSSIAADAYDIVVSPVMWPDFARGRDRRAKSDTFNE